MRRQTGFPDRLLSRQKGHALPDGGGDSGCLEWKQANDVPGLWETPPVMVTATLDDAMGHGLDLIHQYAEAAGLRLIKLGLLQPPDKIIQACREENARILGLTVLQQFSDEDAVRIGCSIPEETLFIAGGAAFLFDPDLAQEAQVDHAAKDAFVLSVVFVAITALVDIFFINKSRACFIQVY